MANVKSRTLVESQRVSLSPPGKEAMLVGMAGRPGVAAISPVVSSSTISPADGLRLPQGGPLPGIISGGVTETLNHPAGGPLQQTPFLGPPPLANAVVVSPQRGPSRQGPPRKPQSIGKFLPEFQFTVEPSLLRRLLVSLIVAFISPSLLKEDLFPPLTLIISRQAVFRKLQ